MQIRYSRLFAEADGSSRFSDEKQELQLGFAAPPAEPLHWAPFMPATDVFWMGATTTWRGDAPHPAPKRMVFVTVQGEYQITATNGETRRFPVGSVLLIENTVGKGHMTRNISSGETVVIAITLPPA